MERKQSTSVMLLLLYAMLIVALLVLVVVGAKLYATALEARNAHSDRRLAISYIQSQAASFSADRISLKPGPEGDMLVLREADDAYETRIYLYDAALRSEFCAASAELDPNNSQIICPLSDLRFEMQGNLLRVDTLGSVGYVCSYGGGAHD